MTQAEKLAEMNSRNLFRSVVRANALSEIEALISFDLTKEVLLNEIQNILARCQSEVSESNVNSLMAITMEVA